MLTYLSLHLPYIYLQSLVPPLPYPNTSPCTQGTGRASTHQASPAQPSRPTLGQSRQHGTVYKAIDQQQQEGCGDLSTRTECKWLSWMYAPTDFFLPPSLWLPPPLLKSPSPYRLYYNNESPAMPEPLWKS